MIATRVSVVGLLHNAYATINRMNVWAHRQRAFTIVELLVVIVVIAILAAISILSYNGVTIRAENTKTLDAVSKYVEGLTAYAATHNGYPITFSSVPCLGTPKDGKCGNITDTVSEGCGPYSMATQTDAGFNIAMKEVMSDSPPEPSSQILTCGGRQYTGAHYYALNATEAYITYYLRGNQPCDTLKEFTSTDKYQEGDTTVCMGTLTWA